MGFSENAPDSIEALQGWTVRPKLFPPTNDHKAIFSLSTRLDLGSCVPRYMFDYRRLHSWHSFRQSDRPYGGQCF
jgi:hypothetical protein